MIRRRYELQVKSDTSGWVSAGNWPARDRAEGLKSLGELTQPFGSSKFYRLVRLVPKVIARGCSKKEST